MGQIIKVYAVWHKNPEVIRDCTSGGVASALAEDIIRKHGIVVGAAYDANLNVRHEVVENLDGLIRLRGVKYVCGTIGPDVYSAMRKALEAGRQVMFTGLPCQVAAVRKMLGVNPNLLLCDVVCFGAPPHSLWRRYIDWMEGRKGMRLVNVNPRDKNTGWGRKTYYRYDWADGGSERRLSIYDPYSQAFYSAIGFRKCCFSCKFRGKMSVADLTLCDFWGAERLGLPPKVMKNGVSGVIVRTVKGTEVMDCANVERVEADYKVLSEENKPVESSAVMPSRWPEFAKDSFTMDFGGLACKYGLQVSRFQVAKWRIWEYASKWARRIKVL